jgi:hypothetical protein
MGNWGCWFYDCQPGCTHEVCEQLPDVSALGVDHVRSTDKMVVSSGLRLPLLEDSCSIQLASRRGVSADAGGFEV